ncbi:prostate androgen-regulated mucin-like protein 1 [Zootoca vivipara]|uniref:prostate androgen-regulated mucin-like protein 1 n=1 Tax=Zootoca vivipara TaxID=8524 RepID=UPI00293C0FC0|nr:prostate androgen-regulated mucin-like protein 1 [Zootoca vivipara]
MAHRGGRALAAFLLAVTAAGLNVSCASSPTPSSTVRSGTTELNDPAATTSVGPPLSTQKGASVTLTLPGGLSTQDSATAPTTTVEALSANPVSAVTSLSGATAPGSSAAAHSSPQPNTGLQTTEDTSASATPVAGTIPHSETAPVSSSPTLNGSSTNPFPTNATYLSTAGATQVPSAETSPAAVSSSKLPTGETTSGETSAAASSPGSTQGATISSQVDLSSKATPVTSTGSTTFSVGVTIQEVQRALSSGSIAAITIVVIAVVLLVFGIAAFLKIRHSSYGRLLDDHDYGSWGNYNNPLYDDS